MDAKYGPPLREEHILRVFKNGMLREIFGPKIKMSKVGWKTLYSKEIHDLYSLPMWIRWVGYVAYLLREVKCIKGSDRKFQVRLLGRCTCRQADNKK